MSDILFRAKNFDNEWIYGSLVREIDEDFIHYVDNFIDDYLQEPVERNTVSQYTGLLDKNIKRIFAGDIVKFNNQIGKVVNELGSFGIVIEEGIDYERLEKFIKSNLDNSFDGTFNDNFIPLFEIYWNFNNTGDCIEEIDVIGNIYDNPELLEVGNE